MRNHEEAKWYIFYCSSRAEKKVADMLEKAGVRVYLPLISTLRQWSDRKKKVQLPLFSGYIFVHVQQHQIGDIRQFPGIVAPLYQAGKYSFLRQEEIDNIEQIILFGSSISTEELPAPGDSIIVEEGPLRGLKGVCLSQQGNNYLYVRIESVHQYIKVKIPAGAVRVTEK